MRASIPLNCLVLIALALTQPASGQAPPPPPPPLLPLGPPPVPAQNLQTPAKIALGQALFWDEQLSATGTIACGTCHMPQAGGSDPRAVAGNRHPGPDGQRGTADDIIGAAGVPRHGADGIYLDDALFGMRPQVGTRQSISAINAAYPPLLFWDGRAASQFVDPDTQQLLIATGGALESQALGPLVNSAEMAHMGGELIDMQTRIANAAPLKLAASVPAGLRDWIAARDYPALFAEVFGDATISAARIALAIASYERSLVANQTPLDAELSGTPSLTPLEQQGRQVYAQAGCQRCHGGPLLSDDNFHYTGVRPQAADPGRFAVTGQNADRGRLRTPGLRNIELTAPYMADGRFATLEDVIAFYARGGDFTAPNRAPQITPINLTPGQRAALAAFLRRPLTDPRVVAQSGPFERPILFSESDAVPVPVGQGQPGTAGVTPTLLAIEPPLAGASSFTIAVEQAAPGAVAIVLLDLVEPASVDSPNLVRQDFITSAQGKASLNISLPNEALLDAQDIYVRVFIEDAGASQGWSATPSARFRLLDVSDVAVFGNGFE